VSEKCQPYALCVCDMRDKDHPIIFANDNFFVQTGYSPEVGLYKCVFGTTFLFCYQM
jgi:hypothetical protein